MTVNVQGNAQIYNIFQYGGTLTQTPGTIFSVAPTINGLPGGTNSRLEVVAPGLGPSATPGVIRLLVYDANNEIAQYWNGGAPPPYDGGLVGGSGTWIAGLANWTDQNGANPAAWASSLGIFDGTGGSVVASGTLGFDRLQFDADKYSIEGGAGNALTLSPYSAGSGVMTVTNGGHTAVIGVDIGNGNNYSASGSGAVVSTLEKRGAGTLVFTGTKSYTGLTTVSEGTLQLGYGGQAGGLTGGATVVTGARFGGVGSVGGDVAINTGATLLGDQSGTLAIAGDLAFQTGTTLQIGLSTPSATPLFTSNTLTLGGVGATTINLDASGAQSGVYSLINSATAPSAPKPEDQFALGSNIPTGSSVTYTPVGHVYLNLAGSGPSGPAFVYWDGPTKSGMAPISGGDGDWNVFDANNTNWGDADPPTAHSDWSQGDIAIFTGNAGTVNVDTNSGANPVEAGGLQFATKGYVIDGDMLTLTSVNPDNLAEIAVGPGSTVSATINSVLGGTAGINKTGAGEIILAGDNIYSGGTMLTSGVVSVSRDVNLGAPSAGLAFAGGALKVTKSFETGRAMTIDKHGGTIDVANGGDTLTASGIISDETGETGSLQKTGAGTLALSGDNTYSGGTAIREGTVSIGKDQNLGAATGGVLLDGGRLSTASSFDTARTFELTSKGGTIDIADGADTLTATGRFVNATGQTGGLTKTGNGTLLMVDDNTYTGQTTISGGTLQLGNNGASGALSGDVAVETGAHFNVLRSTDWAFNGVLSGDGSFGQLGAGTTTLTADSSKFAGATTVNNGGLAVAGKLGGMTTVSETGLLSGNGLLERVAVIKGGKITAGTANSIDTLSMDTLSFTPGSGLYANVVSKSTDEGVEARSDLLEASGAVTVAGGQVTVDAQGASVVDGTTVTIVSSSDSVTRSDGDGDGTAGFDTNVASTSAFVGAEIGYTANTVFLTLKDLTNNGTTLCIPGLTANQCNTAGGINSLGPNDPLVKIIKGLPKNQLGPSLDQLSGEGYSSIASAMVDDSRYVRDATNTRLRQTYRDPQKSTASLASNYAADDGSAPTLLQEAPGTGAWMTAYGSWNDYKATGTTAGMKNNVGGVFIGADIPVFDTLRFGAVAGYGGSSYDISGRRTSATSNDWTVGLYGGGDLDNWGVNFGTAYTWHQISADRQVAIPGLSEQESADYNAGTYQVYGDVDYMFELASNFNAGPFADAAYVYQQTDGFTEQGGIAALSRAGSTMNTGFTTLGLRTSYDLESEIFNGQLVASAGWRRGYGDLAGIGSLAFPSGTSFDVTGAPIAKDQAVLNVGLQTSINESLDIEVNYIGLFAEDYQSQNVVGRLNLRF
ncbi:autotransporter domain-containing protein, partial [Martelella radicis]|uniref:Outer membrane autotransporter protein n=1 Tax=Martelella radicis TaxID=1397476 RepID=A0A7W6PDF3_9HYPH